MQVTRLSHTFGYEASFMPFISTYSTECEDVSSVWSICGSVFRTIVQQVNKQDYQTALSCVLNLGSSTKSPKHENGSSDSAELEKLLDRAVFLSLSQVHPELVWACGLSNETPLDAVFVVAEGAISVSNVRSKAISEDFSASTLPTLHRDSSDEGFIPALPALRLESSDDGTPIDAVSDRSNDNSK